jgi:hypothetical protein
VSDQSRGADAQHLCCPEDEEHEVPADGDRRDRLGAKTANPVKVHQHIERLEDHTDQHEAGGLEKVTGE